VEEIDFETFREESEMSILWHMETADFLFQKYNPEFFLHGIYTPNQFLEAPFWMGHVDSTNPRVYDPATRNHYWNDIVSLYQGLDSIIGEYLKKADKNTIIVFSADHGIAPLHRRVRLNNLFAKKGWLKFRKDSQNGIPKVDWKRTKVVYLKMAYIYISPTGFGENGLWERKSGPEYESLRDEIIEELYALEDTNGSKPLAFALKWEDASVLHLPSNRIGDIIISARPPYGWSENMNEDLTIFHDSVDTGFKQTVTPTHDAILTPFLIMGAGIKKGVKLDRPINHVDQMPTLLHLMGIDIPPFVQGKIIFEALK